MNRNTSFWVVLGVLVASAAGLWGALRLSSVYLQKGALTAPRPLRAIPAESAGWIRVGEDHIEAADVVKTLGTENYVTRVVVRKGASAGQEPAYLQFHAAYYSGMIDTVPHVPERCFVGGGMQRGSRSEILRVPLDLTSRDSMLRREDSDAFLRGKTPEEYRPIRSADGTTDVWWVRLSNIHSERKGEMVRVPFDPAKVQMTVSTFIGEGERPTYAGYFFIANGGVTPSANQVRQLAFKLEDRYAYYIKLQFTSTAVNSPEELAALAGDFLDENLGEILLCTPDWIRVRMRQDAGLDPNAPDGET